MKKSLAALLLPCLLLPSCGTVADKSATTTAATTTEDPAFEIRRPSAEQDELLTMERIVDPHGSADYLPPIYTTFDDFITHADNPYAKPSMLRVSIVNEESIGEPNLYQEYYTVIQCKIEEIYYLESNVNLQVGGTNLYLYERRGVKNNEMWYYEGWLPTLDCYEYYVLGYLSDPYLQPNLQADDAYAISSLMPHVVPVVDCIEQYQETMQHYGFALNDYFAMCVPREVAMDFIVNSNLFFKDSSQLTQLQENLAEDEQDRYWKDIVDPNIENLPDAQTADQIKLGMTIDEVIALLGAPQEIEISRTNTLVFTMPGEYAYIAITCDYLNAGTPVVGIARRYDQSVLPNRSIVENLQMGISYEEMERLLGAPKWIYMDQSRAEYDLIDGSSAIITIDFTQPQPIVTSIWIQ